MGRTLLAAVLVSTCLLPSLTQAQTSSSRGAGGRGGRVSAPPPQPPGQPALPPGVPLVPPAPPSSPPIGPFASPSALNRDVFQAGPRAYAPRYSRSRGFNYGGYSGGGYITDPFGYISQPDSSAPALDRYMREGNTPEGYLRLDVEPASAQVYVDGLYIGTVADLRSGGYPLDAGPHRVEIRADGFNSQSVELRIRANDVLSYRGTLTARDLRPEQRAAAAPPKTFYVIPRCYAGDTPPIPEQLPASCKGAKARTVPPVVSPSQPAGTSLRK